MDKEELKELLKKANLTKKELAKLTDLAHSTVNNWGSGQNVPRWVKSWLENYIKANDMEQAAKTVQSVEKIIETRSETQQVLEDMEKIQKLLKNKNVDTLLDFMEALEPFFSEKQKG